MKRRPVEIAREVFRVESEAVARLVDRLDESFDRAVEEIFRCRGRIIVTGMGKPGIIARKISATLASIGVHSYSMSPAEARHGDLGMVARDDVVVAISNSGETEEMVALIPSLKELGAGLISLTGNRASTLARHSDIVLDVRVEREACPLGLAPTASTTAALAMGDALAVALIEKKGLRPEDFGRSHPGGSLGLKLRKVEDVMRKGKANPIVHQDLAIREVLLAITSARAGAASVAGDDGKLVGIFTDGDLRRSIEREPDLTTHSIRDFMVKDPITITCEKTVGEALEVMSGGNPKGKKLDELPVVDAEGRPMGMLDVVDLIR